MIAALIGGTGLTGSTLLTKLLADADISEVISVVRRSSKSKSPKLRDVLVKDLSELPQIADKIRADIYFCALGTTIKAAGSRAAFEKVDHTAIVEFAKLAKFHDAKSFTLVSAIGANPNSLIFYNQVKGRTERDVQGLGLRSLNIFRPALLVGSRHEFRLGESLALRTVVPISQLLPTRWSKAIVSKVETLATRMLAEGKAARPGSNTIVAKDI